METDIIDDKDSSAFWWDPGLAAVGCPAQRKPDNGFHEVQESSDHCSVMKQGTALYSSTTTNTAQDHESAADREASQEDPTCTKVEASAACWSISVVFCI